MNYYNEHDLKTAAWLRELINQGLIPAGDVDTRSIVDVRPADLTPYIQCHFFAGICGWPLALQLAGVPATARLWTGSCPCQPFSSAGKGLAQADERHLWPIFFDLIRQCRPDTVIGEQVSSAIGHGWLDGISADLEAEGYACGATVLGAHSVSAPHQRQRLYWVAHNASAGLEGATGTQLHRGGGGLAGLREAGTLAYSSSRERDERGSAHSQSGAVSKLVRCSEADGLANAESGRAWDDESICIRGTTAESVAHSEAVGLEQSDSRRCELGEEQHRGTLPNPTNGGSRGQHADGPSGHLWADFQLVHCRDGKTRRIPTEPAFFPLAHGVPARVVRLRGYGNAIVPQVAAAFIQAFYETQQPPHDDWI
jgi:DNA (cytosine-5)-methyltransferase 1